MLQLWRNSLKVQDKIQDRKPGVKASICIDLLPCCCLHLTFNLQYAKPDGELLNPLSLCHQGKSEEVCAIYSRPSW